MSRATQGLYPQRFIRPCRKWPTSCFHGGISEYGNRLASSWEKCSQDCVPLGSSESTEKPRQDYLAMLWPLSQPATKPVPAGLVQTGHILYRLDRADTSPRVRFAGRHRFVTASQAEGRAATAKLAVEQRRCNKPHARPAGTAYLSPPIHRWEDVSGKSRVRFGGRHEFHNSL